MINLIQGKKGDKIISVYWFAILFIVAAAIVYMVASFYGQPYEVRKLESNALDNLIVRCLTDKNYLGEGIILDGKINPVFVQNFAEECRFNFETEDSFGWKDKDQYYASVNFYDFNFCTHM